MSDIAIQSPKLVWALKGVSFKVRRSGVVGIIGRNGAGNPRQSARASSTPLKILSRITEQAEGGPRRRPERSR